MANYFTDTIPVSEIQLGHYTVSPLGTLPDEGIAKPYRAVVEWDVIHLSYTKAREWYDKNNTTKVLLQGVDSMQDFKTSGLGNESDFDDAPNRLTGNPISLGSGDSCLVMHRQEPLGILRWKLIKDVSVKVN